MISGGGPIASVEAEQSSGAKMFADGCWLLRGNGRVFCADESSLAVYTSEDAAQKAREKRQICMSRLQPEHMAWGDVVARYGKKLKGAIINWYPGIKGYCQTIELTN